jgi:hypothetical protein
MEPARPYAATVKAGFDEAWARTLGALAEYGCLVAVSDRKAGIVNCMRPLSRAESKEFILQGPPQGTVGMYYDRSKAHISFQAESIDDRTTRIRATTRIETVLHSMWGSSYEGVHGRLDLNSNGILERRILEAIRLAVGVGLR